MNKFDLLCAWIASVPKDKLLHALCGMLFALCVTRAFCAVGLGHVRLLAFLSAVLIGLAKEVYDRYIKHGRFDCYDWLATAIGGGIVVLLA